MEIALGSHDNRQRSMLSLALLTGSVELTLMMLTPDPKDTTSAG